MNKAKDTRISNCNSGGASEDSFITFSFFSSLGEQLTNKIVYISSVQCDGLICNIHTVI